MDVHSGAPVSYNKEQMLPPTIPTSFVPHTSSAKARPSRTDFVGAFGFITYLLLGITFILAVGVFVYDRALANTQAAKDTALANAVDRIDLATVEGFVRLHDRLTWGETLLNEHVAFSTFFSSLEKIIPTSVRFSSMHLSFGDSKAPKFDGSGTAKNFNALAAASIAFARDGRIKSAIFSDININKDSSVTFALSATLDPKIIAFSPSTPAAVAAPVASTTPSL